MNPKNVIDIGVKINLEVLMETRLMVESDSGSGKSRALRKMAEECSGKVQQIIIDPEGEFVTLREKFPFALVCKTGGDIPLNIRYAEALAHKILETGISVIIDLYELKQPDRELFLKLFCEALMDAPKHLRHSLILYIDECQLYCPEDKRAICTQAIIDVATRGRKRGICLVVATLRISILNKSLAAQCKNKLMGSTSLPLDQKRVGEELGLATKEEIRNLRNLEKGEFYAFGAAISKEIVKFRTGAIKTTHLSSGSKVVSLPPTPAAIKKILSKLESIPDEAEKELNTKQQLQAEVKRLTLKLKEKPSTIVDTVVDEKAKRQVVVLQQELKEERRFSSDLKKAINKINVSVEKAKEALDVNIVVEPPKPQKNISFDNNGTLTVPANSKMATVLALHPNNADAPSGDGDTELSKSAKIFLRVMCMYYPNFITRSRLSLFTGYKITSSNFASTLSQLRIKKYLIDGADGQVAASENGYKNVGAFEPLPTDSNDLRSYWSKKVSKSASKFFLYLFDRYPEYVPREDISEATGYLLTSSNFASTLSQLRVLGLIQDGADKTIRAHEDLFSN